MGLRPGMTVLEVSPGSGYVSVPAAGRLGTAGRAVALELQPEVAARARRRWARAGIENGAVTGAALEPAPYDRAFLVTVLGEIAARATGRGRPRDALKPAAILPFSEMFGDPHHKAYANLALHWGRPGANWPLPLPALKPRPHPPAATQAAPPGVPAAGE